MNTFRHRLASRTFRRVFLVLLGCLALLAPACGGPADRSASQSGDSEPAASPSQDASTPESEAGEDGVEYEPAYPEDVSADGLSESDTAQQHGHPHDDGEHQHSDESMHGDQHEHGGDEDHHEHGDGGDDGDDDHSH